MFTFNLGAQNAIVNIAHAQLLQYGVDSGQQKLKTWLYLQKEGSLGANRLPCIGLNPTRSAYFGSDGCKMVRNEFPPLHLVQTSRIFSNTRPRVFISFLTP